MIYGTGNQSDKVEKQVSNCWLSQGRPQGIGGPRRSEFGGPK